MITQIENTFVELNIGDITESDTDAIVNPANSALQLGGGVAGAIRKKGGPLIQRECDKIGHCEVGHAVITSAGELKARYVIHAVGPRMGEGDEDDKLSDTVLNALKLAEEHCLQSITFPAVSTGIFGYPIDRCASVMLSTVAGYIKNGTNIRKICICLFDSHAYETFRMELERF
ncbi:MAG: macro domain-containing protein [Candidatus Auribacterota bacterium]